LTTIGTADTHTHTHTHTHKSPAVQQKLTENVPQKVAKEEEGGDGATGNIKEAK